MSSLPRGERFTQQAESRNFSLMLAGLGAASVSVFILYFIRHLGIVTVLVGSFLLLMMEAYLLLTLLRSPLFIGRKAERREDWKGRSMIERSASIAKHAFRGRPYSQHLILNELQTILNARMCTYMGVSSRELKEIVDREGASVFGSTLLYSLYTDSLMSPEKSRLRPMAASRFIEMFNSLVDGIRNIE